MEVSDLLRERRHELGKTQERVAREAEMNVTQYNAYERGRSAPSPLTMLRLAKALETTPEELLPRAPVAKLDRADNETRGDVLRRLRDQFRANVAAELDVAVDDITIRVEVVCSEGAA